MRIDYSHFLGLKSDNNSTISHFLGLKSDNSSTFSHFLGLKSRAVEPVNFCRLRLLDFLKAAPAPRDQKHIGSLRLPCPAKNGSVEIY